MAKLNSIAVNGMVYELPTTQQFSSELQNLSSAMRSFGVSAQELCDNVRMMNEVLSRLSALESRMDYREADANDIREELQFQHDALEGRTAYLETELNDLRSALDAKTENPNQKSDLEIFSPIVWDEDFLKILEEPIRVDF